MKIGIFGGSFDPITDGHIYVVRKVLENTSVDQVWILPCYKSLYDKKLTEGKHRCAMIQDAISMERFNGKVKLCSWEIDNKVVGRTYDIMEKLCEDHKEHELKFVIGGDNVDKVPKQWYRGEELIEKYNFITVPRRGYHPETDWWLLDDNEVAYSELEATSFSSTEVRKGLKERAKYINGLAPWTASYIIQHNLYEGE